MQYTLMCFICTALHQYYDNTSPSSRQCDKTLNVTFQNTTLKHIKENCILLFTPMGATTCFKKWRRSMGCNSMFYADFGIAFPVVIVLSNISMIHRYFLDLVVPSYNWSVKDEYKCT